MFLVLQSLLLWRAFTNAQKQDKPFGGVCLSGPQLALVEPGSQKWDPQFLWDLVKRSYGRLSSIKEGFWNEILVFKPCFSFLSMQKTFGSDFERNYSAKSFR